MSEKNMGRKFNVGDKVVFTKEAIDSGIFHKSIQVGDLAVVKSVKNCVGGSFPTEVLPERDGLWIQRVDMDYEPEVYEWFEHVDTKKEYKKKHKHFRMGDFVKLKDGACLEECSIFGDITRSTIGIVCGMGHDGAAEVHFTTVTGYNFDRVYPEALRLATKEERKTLRKHKVAKITYDDLATEETEQDTEVTEAKIPSEYDVKVGDIVEVTEYCGGYPAGTIGQVTTINENIEGYHNHVVVRYTDGNYWNEVNVKVLSRPNTSSQKDNYDVKTGDIVEVTLCIGNQPIGTMGEVLHEIEGDMYSDLFYNRVMVKSFDGESSPEMNVKLVYRKPETKFK